MCKFDTQFSYFIEFVYGLQTFSRRYELSFAGYLSIPALSLVSTKCLNFRFAVMVLALNIREGVPIHCGESLFSME